MKYLDIDFVDDNSTIWNKKQFNKRYDYDGSKDIIVAIITVLSFFIPLIVILIAFHITN